MIYKLHCIFTVKLRLILYIMMHVYAIRLGEWFILVWIGYLMPLIEILIETIRLLFMFDGGFRDLHPQLLDSLSSWNSSSRLEVKLEASWGSLYEFKIFWADLLNGRSWPGQADPLVRFGHFRQDVCYHLLNGKTQTLFIWNLKSWNFEISTSPSDSVHQIRLLKWVRKSKKWPHMKWRSDFWILCFETLTHPCVKNCNCKLKLIEK